MDPPPPTVSPPTHRKPPATDQDETDESSGSHPQPPTSEGFRIGTEGRGFLRPSRHPYVRLKTPLDDRTPQQSAGGEGTHDPPAQPFSRRNNIPGTDPPAHDGQHSHPRVGHYIAGDRASRMKEAFIQGGGIYPSYSFGSVKGGSILVDPEPRFPRRLMRPDAPMPPPPSPPSASVIDLLDAMAQNRWGPELRVCPHVRQDNQYWHLSYKGHCYTAYEVMLFMTLTKLLRGDGHAKSTTAKVCAEVIGHGRLREHVEKSLPLDCEFFAEIMVQNLSLSAETYLLWKDDALGHLKRWLDCEDSQETELLMMLLTKCPRRSGDGFSRMRK